MKTCTETKTCNKCKFQNTDDCKVKDWDIVELYDKGKGIAMYIPYVPLFVCGGIIE